MPKQHHPNKSSVTRKRSENNEWSLERVGTARLSILFLDFRSAEGGLTDHKDAIGCPKDKTGEHFKLLLLLV